MVGILTSFERILLVGGLAFVHNLGCLSLRGRNWVLTGSPLVRHLVVILKLLPILRELLL